MALPVLKGRRRPAPIIEDDMPAEATAFHGPDSAEAPPADIDWGFSGPDPPRAPPAPTAALDDDGAAVAEPVAPSPAPARMPDLAPREAPAPAPAQACHHAAYAHDDAAADLEPYSPWDDDVPAPPAQPAPRSSRPEPRPARVPAAPEASAQPRSTERQQPAAMRQDEPSPAAKPDQKRTLVWSSVIDLLGANDGALQRVVCDLSVPVAALVDVSMPEGEEPIECHICHGAPLVGPLRLSPCEHVACAPCMQRRAERSKAGKPATCVCGKQINSVGGLERSWLDRFSGFAATCRRCDWDGTLFALSVHQCRPKWATLGEKARKGGGNAASRIDLYREAVKDGVERLEARPARTLPTDAAVIAGLAAAGALFILEAGASAKHPPDTARHLADQGLRADRDCVACHVARGRALLAQAQLGQATSAAAKALKLSPDNRSAQALEQAIAVAKAKTKQPAVAPPEATQARKAAAAPKPSAAPKSAPAPTATTEATARPTNPRPAPVAVDPGLSRTLGGAMGLRELMIRTLMASAADDWGIVGMLATDAGEMRPDVVYTKCDEVVRHLFSTVRQVSPATAARLDEAHVRKGYTDFVGAFTANLVNFRDAPELEQALFDATGVSTLDEMIAINQVHGIEPLIDLRGLAEQYLGQPLPGRVVVMWCEIAKVRLG